MKHVLRSWSPRRVFFSFGRAETGWLGLAGGARGDKVFFRDMLEKLGNISRGLKLAEWSGCEVDWVLPWEMC